MTVQDNRKPDLILKQTSPSILVVFETRAGGSIFYSSCTVYLVASGPGLEDPASRCICMGAGCAAEGTVTASDLRWPYEGALTLTGAFPLGFVHVGECAWLERNGTDLCSVASCCCADAMFNCTLLPYADRDAWRMQSAAAGATVEVGRTVFAASAVPCAVFAFLLLASASLLAKVRRSRRAVCV